MTTMLPEAPGASIEECEREAATDAAAEGSPFIGGEWVHLEIMGHRQHYGYAREVRRAGVDLLEILVPGEKPGEIVERKRYSGSAIFSETPMTEEAVRAKLTEDRRWHEVYASAHRTDVRARQALGPSLSEISNWPDNEVAAEVEDDEDGAS